MNDQVPAKGKSYWPEEGVHVDCDLELAWMVDYDAVDARRLWQDAGEIECRGRERKFSSRIWRWKCH